VYLFCIVVQTSVIDAEPQSTVRLRCQNHWGSERVRTIRLTDESEVQQIIQLLLELGSMCWVNPIILLPVWSSIRFERDGVRYLSLNWFRREFRGEYIWIFHSHLIHELLVLRIHVRLTWWLHGYVKHIEYVRGIGSTPRLVADKTVILIKTVC